ncbi:MAG: hypothetical protein V3V55_03000 [Rhodospirillales bacterium]
MLQFLFGLLCGVWIYKLYIHYRTQDRRWALLEEVISKLRRVGRSKEGKN